MKYAGLSETTGTIYMPADFEPYYVQIMADIRRRIASGEWPPGFKLPSTPELTVLFRDLLGARSNINVRRAIAELKRTGELRAHQGAGVWVAGGEDQGS